MTFTNRVSEGMWTLHCTSLDLPDICVVTDNLTEGSSLHFNHELIEIVEVGASVAEEEPVAILKIVKLQTDQTGECGTKQGVRVHWVFSNGCWVDVYVVHSPVEQLKSCPHLMAHLKWLLGERGDGCKVADLPEGVVIRNPVVSASLDVPCH